MARSHSPAPGELTHRQRRRMEGLSRVNNAPIPGDATRAEAERWIQEQEAVHRGASLRARDEL